MQGTYNHMVVLTTGHSVAVLSTDKGEPAVYGDKVAATLYCETLRARFPVMAANINVLSFQVL